MGAVFFPLISDVLRETVRMSGPEVMMKKVKIVRMVALHLFLLYGQHVTVFAKPGKSKNIDIWSDERSGGEGEVFEESNNSVGYSSVRSDGDFTRFARVLNFFPVPVEEECNANDGRRKGICMNTYECRIQGGKSYGFCALGFGVCCVFTATCDQEAFNNITYFVNPDFPDLTSGMSTCSLTVKKIDPEIAQFRLDFIHFNLGQPNRRTGVCEEDIFLMSSGSDAKELTICGLNSGQHAYFDVENINEPVKISMNLSRKAVTRLWEVRVTQVPFSQRAPAGCLQYHEGSAGIIQTMNFADNGRHLVNQEYNICMRQEEGMCSIAYEPCHENAFRIDPNTGDESTVGGDDGATDPEELGSGEDPGESRKMETCNDKIVLPCDSDDLILPGDEDPIIGFCDITHCGPTLCPRGETRCRIESSATPFVVGVHFGPSAKEASPEDNLGMCLTYEQLPCNV